MLSQRVSCVYVAFTIVYHSILITLLTTFLYVFAPKDAFECHAAIIHM